MQLPNKAKSIEEAEAIYLKVTVAFNHNTEKTNKQTKTIKQANKKKTVQIMSIDLGQFPRKQDNHDESLNLLVLLRIYNGGIKNDTRAFFLKEPNTR